MSSAATTCVVLQPKGTTRNALLSPSVLAAATENKPTVAAAAAIVRRATAPDAIGTWKWKEYTVHLFGYKTGKADTENKHELPPPHDKVLLFGEAVLFATLNKTGTLATFGTADYTKFYNETLGGFDDIGSEDSDTEDEEDDEEGEEVDEEVAAEDDAGAEEEESESESEEEEEDEEEEAAGAAARAPVRRAAVARGTGARSAAAKRNAKKLPAWYSIPPLKAEPYLLQKASAGGAAGQLACVSKN